MSTEQADNRKFAPWEQPTAAPLIEFDNVSKSFGGHQAISDLSLRIYEREFFALLGPSGCGKTTLMRMLAGFETPTTGRILLNGEDIATVPPNKRPFNMMFQSYALFPHQTVADNIAFGLKRAGMPRTEIAERVEQMLALVQLKGLEGRKPHQISGGQRQRVALARALARQPKLLLLDEPLGALDKKLRQKTQLELMDIQDRLGTTFVIVTHDQEEAMTVASRIAVMHRGNLVQVATPLDIYEFPNSRFVADFIGEVNIIEGTSRRTGLGGYDVVWSDRLAPLSATSVKEMSDGDACWLAVRPEKVRVSKDRPTGAANALAGTVIDIAYLGDVSGYRVQVEGGPVLMAQMTNRRRDAADHFDWGDGVWLSWDADAAVLLNS
ncbi:MAG: ABC transporter ATP-binding protein [Paracoccaceae bacterium]